LEVFAATKTPSEPLNNAEGGPSCFVMFSARPEG